MLSRKTLPGEGLFWNCPTPCIPGRTTIAHALPASTLQLYIHQLTISPVTFEWHEPKNSANFKKHGATKPTQKKPLHHGGTEPRRKTKNNGFYPNRQLMVESQTRAWIFSAFSLWQKNEDTEVLILPQASAGRILLVVFCEKGQGSVIRIIGARKATAKERKQYEELL